MYYSCHCIKRNGLQHDCRRTGCGGEPACLTLPDPLCAPSQLARARGLADPAALAAHTGHGSSGSSGPADSSTGGGKRFIVCELKGIVPDVSLDKSGKCCKCPDLLTVPAQKTLGGYPCATGSYVQKPSLNVAGCFDCPCASSLGMTDSQAMFVFDEETIQTILNSFNTKDLATNKGAKVGPGGRIRNELKPVGKEVCTRPGCVHWQPPPPCVWDLPCKADCFENPAGIQPGHNPLTRGGGGCIIESEGKAEIRGTMQGGSHQHLETMKLLTPECCTGCSASSGGAAAASGGSAAGLPVLVMKLC